MKLSPAEKAAGRQFRDDCYARLFALNQEDPAGMVVLSVHSCVRHDCEKQGGRSVGIELREKYETSPQYWVYPHSGLVAGVTVLENPVRGRPVAAVIPVGKFAYIWKEGRCPACGLVARSGDGRFVIAEDRPPERTHRGPHDPGSARRGAGERHARGELDEPRAGHRAHGQGHRPG